MSLGVLAAQKAVYTLSYPSPCRRSGPCKRSSVPLLDILYSVFGFVAHVPPMSPLSVVFVPVTPFSVSIPPLIFVITAVPLMVFMISVPPFACVISERWPAAVAFSVQGIASRAPPRGGGISHLSGVFLRACGAQSIEEEALVGALEWTFQPARGGNTVFQEQDTICILTSHKL